MASTPKEFVTRSGVRSWRVRVRTRGVESSETFSTLQGARVFAGRVDVIGADAAVQERNRRDARSDEYVPTLAERLTHHITALTGVTDRTRMDYLAMARRTWLPDLGPMPLDQVERSHISAMVNALSARGLSRKSIANTHSLLSAVMADAHAEGLIEHNPCLRTRLPRGGEVERRDARYLTHAEYEALIGALPATERPLAMTLFWAGLRWSEATALTVGDLIDGTPPGLRVNKAWKQTPGRPAEIGPPKSLKSRRVVAIPAALFEVLRPLASGREPSALLFRAEKGGRVHHSTWRYRTWVPSCHRAGLAPPPRIHDARHTHASWLLSSPGVTLEMVQDQLGHESILTTRRVYGHLLPEARNRLAEALTVAMASRAALAAVEQRQDPHALAAGEGGDTGEDRASVHPEGVCDLARVI